MDVQKVYVDHEKTEFQFFHQNKLTRNFKINFRKHIYFICPFRDIYTEREEMEKSSVQCFTTLMPEGQGWRGPSLEPKTTLSSSTWVAEFQTLEPSSTDCLAPLSFIYF